MAFTPQQGKKFSLSIGIGVAVFFLIVSLITGNWKFFLYSLGPSFIAMMTGYGVAKAEEKKQSKTK